MAVLLGKTVVHKVAVHERSGVGLTACGIAFTLGDERYDPNGKFGHEGYLEVLMLNDAVDRELGMLPAEGKHW